MPIESSVKDEGFGIEGGRVKLHPSFATITFFSFLHMSVVTFYIIFSKVYILWF